MYVHPSVNANVHTSLILDIHFIINWHLSKQCIRWPVSPRSAVFFLKLTADQILVFNWIAGATKIKTRLHFSRTFCDSTRLHGRTTSTLVVTQSTLFVFRWKTVWFQSSLTYHDSCGPHWWLRSYSSQASEGYKFKVECLLLICVELLFFLCIAIFSNF